MAKTKKKTGTTTPSAKASTSKKSKAEVMADAANPASVEVTNGAMMQETASPEVAATDVAAPEAVATETVNAQQVAEAPVAEASAMPTEDAIRRRAYEIYCERGGSAGNPLEDWQRAERELRGM